MSHGILEDEGDEASDQKKKALNTRLENGGRQIELLSGSIPQPVTSFSSNSEDETTISGADLSKNVFGNQCSNSSETLQGENNSRDVDDHELVQNVNIEYSNFTSEPHDRGSKEEDEGGGDEVDHSVNQLIDPEDMEIERSVIEVTEEMLFKIEHEEWEHVNGIHDCNGEWKEWNEITVETRDPFEDDPLVIMPYVDTTW